MGIWLINDLGTGLVNNNKAQIFFRIPPILNHHILRSVV